MSKPINNNSYDLNKGITQVVPLASKDTNLFCMKKRPCNRIKKCNICWAKRFDYYHQQIESKVYDWNLTHFLTITIQHNLPFEQNTFRLLKLLRKDLTKLMSRKKCKYLMVLALLNRAEQFNPHFHAIVSVVSKESLDRIMMKYFIWFKVQIKPVKNGIGQFKRTLSYKLKMNLRPSLKAKPLKMQLFTASRGYYTGRPRYNLEKFAWLV